MSKGELIKEIKNGIRDKKVPRKVKVLQILAVIVGIILIIMNGNTFICIAIQYSVMRSSMSKLEDMFDLSINIFERYYLNNEISVKIRIVRSLARFKPL